MRQYFLTVLTSIATAGSMYAVEPEMVPQPKEVVINGGVLGISGTGRIVCADTMFTNLGNVFAGELETMFGIRPAVVVSGSGTAGDILLTASGVASTNKEAYEVTVTDRVTLNANSMAGLYPATMTVLQSITASNGSMWIPGMAIRDEPDAGYRCWMFDIKWAGRYSVAFLKQHIDLARFYKLNYVMLHTGEPQWIGAVMDSTVGVPEATKIQRQLYTKQEMEELVRYGSERGVYLVPHNESTPKFHFLYQLTLSSDYNTNDAYAGWVDEVDGLGSYYVYQSEGQWYAVSGGNQTNAYPDARYWNFMSNVTCRSIEQFSAGYPDGHLPWYHVGPIYGEGGMDTATGRKMFDILTTKSPGTKMMFWNGPNPHDTHLYPVREQCVVNEYSSIWGGTFQGYIDAGWGILNATAWPLYITGGFQPAPKIVYENFNLYRSGETVYNTPAAHERCIGAQVCSWEMPPNREFDPCRIRVPVTAELSWNYTNWPYAEGAFDEYLRRFDAQNARLSRYINLTPQAPTSPDQLQATMGGALGKIEISWRGALQDVRAYYLYRSTQDVVSTAQQIAGPLSCGITSYTDTNVVDMTRYYYWCEAVNEAGTSGKGNSVAGYASDGQNNAAASEPFQYKPGQELHGLGGGTGWGDTWIYAGTEHPYVVTNTLSYPEYSGSGGSLRIERPGNSTVQMARNISGQFNIAGSTVWLAWLVKAETTAGDTLKVQVNSNGNFAMGKDGYNRFFFGSNANLEQLVAGTVNLVLARFDFTEGNDTGALWINPDITGGEEPALTNVAATVIAEMGTGSKIDISVSSGAGTYSIDEIRFGRSWTELLEFGVPKEPLPPLGVAASDGTYVDRVSITWYPSLWATNYNVYRGMSVDGTYEHIGESKECRYADFGAIAGTAYYYRIQAVNQISQPMTFSEPDIGWRVSPDVPVEIVSFDVDDNINGLEFNFTSSGGYCYRPWSITVPLSNRDNFQNAVFYGGFTNVTPTADGVLYARFDAGYPVEWGGPCMDIVSMDGDKPPTGNYTNNLYAPIIWLKNGPGPDNDAFQGLAAENPVVLDDDCRITVYGGNAGGDPKPRILIRLNENEWYVSERLPGWEGGIADKPATLNNPGTAAWYRYYPEQGMDMIANTASDITLDNITAIGFLAHTDTLARDRRGFRFTGFEATAKVMIPEPGAIGGGMVAMVYLMKYLVEQQ